MVESWSVVVLLTIIHECASWSTVSMPSGFYADNGLDQTIIYKPLPKKEKREMQQEILHLLGLDHRPKPKTHGLSNSAPKYLIDLYTSFLDEDSGNLKVDESKSHWLNGLNNNTLHVINDSDVIISFVNKVQHHSPHLRHDKDKRFWFDISEVPPNENFMGAELHLYRDPDLSDLPLNYTYTITVYYLSQGHNPKEKLLHSVDSIIVTHNSNGWLVFNVTAPFLMWLAFPDKNLGLYLQIRTESLNRNVDPCEIGLIGAKGLEEQQPFMLAFFQTPTNVHIRRTRAARKRQQTSFNDHEDWNPYLNPQDRYPSRRSCQRWTLYVSFRDLGWQDWIIAPDGYGAFYCHGECSFPLNAHMNATNHAIVQTLVHLMDPFVVPKPCCAPTQLSAITVLYFDDNSNVILKKYKNMVVKSCGCH